MKALSNYKNKPLSEVYHVQLSKPNQGDNRADVERVVAALQEKIQVPVTMPLELMYELPSALRRNNWQLFATINYNWLPANRPEHHLQAQVVSFSAPQSRPVPYGVAVDLGSTTVSGQLWDLNSHQLVAEAACLNEQVSIGEDILSRIFYADTPEKQKHLQRLAAASVNRVITDLVQACKIKATDITAAVISGNTSMTHFLLGLPPQNICRSPYTPVLNNPCFQTAEKLGLSMHPSAAVYLLPNVGSYVGGDVLAGILASGMHRKQEISLLVDIGTNGEMILGNKEWLLAAAGAAGPALEGGVVTCGMRAKPGAVYSVQIDRNSRQVSYWTIDNLPAKGICGSGIIEAISEALMSGIINRRGQFREGRTSLVIVPKEKSATKMPIQLTANDIAKLLRTKAAANAILATLLDQAGYDLTDLNHFYVAGAFGNYLNVEAAITIGLYPDVPRQQIEILGNSSLKGAGLLLNDISKALELAEILKKIAYVEMNDSADFMKHFTAGLFFPHTDLNLSPQSRQSFSQ